MINKKFVWVSSLIAMNVLQGMEGINKEGLKKWKKDKAMPFKKAPLYSVTIGNNAQHIYGSMPSQEPSVWPNFIEKFPFGSNEQPCAQWLVENDPYKIAVNDDESIVVWSSSTERIFNNQKHELLETALYMLENPKDNKKRIPAKTLVDSSIPLAGFAVDGPGNIVYAINQEQGKTPIKKTSDITFLDSKGTQIYNVQVEKHVQHLSFDNASKIVVGALSSAVLFWNPGDETTLEVSIKNAEDNKCKHISYAKKKDERCLACDKFDERSREEDQRFWLIDSEKGAVIKSASIDRALPKVDFSSDGNLASFINDRGRCFLVDLRTMKIVNASGAVLYYLDDFMHIDSDIRFMPNNDQQIAQATLTNGENVAEIWDTRMSEGQKIEEGCTIS